MICTRQRSGSILLPESLGQRFCKKKVSKFHKIFSIVSNETLSFQSRNHLLWLPGDIVAISFGEISFLFFLPAGCQRWPAFIQVLYKSLWDWNDICPTVLNLCRYPFRAEFVVTKRPYWQLNNNFSTSWCKLKWKCVKTASDKSFECKTKLFYLDAPLIPNWLLPNPNHGIIT